MGAAGDDHRKIAFKPELSFGNLVSISVVLVTATVAWGVLTQRVSGTENAIARIEEKQKDNDKEDRKVADQIGRMDERLKSIENTINKQVDLLNEIQRKLNK